MSAQDLIDEDEDPATGAPAEVLEARIDAAGVRLDKALAGVSNMDRMATTKQPPATVT